MIVLLKFTHSDLLGVLYVFFFLKCALYESMIVFFTCGHWARILFIMNDMSIFDF